MRTSQFSVRAALVLILAAIPTARVSAFFGGGVSSSMTFGSASITVGGTTPLSFTITSFNSSVTFTG